MFLKFNQCYTIQVWLCVLANRVLITRPFVSGVMQASNTGGPKLDKRYSPCFRDENGRKQSLGGKRKRDDVFKCVSARLAARGRHSLTLVMCPLSYFRSFDIRRPGNRRRH